MSKGIISSTLISLINKDLKKIQLSWLSATVAAAIFFMSACTKDPGSTGKGVLPQSDLIGLVYSDTNTIGMETRWVENTNTYRSGLQLFGNYVDPYFGTISAATYTEFLPKSGLDFGDASELIFDSLVLSLDIEDFYGRTQTVQNLHIYELTQSFPDTEEMLSSDTLAYDASVDLAHNYQVNFGDNENLGVIRIRLDDELGKRILFASPDTLGDKDLFTQFFKGVYIGTDPVTFISREPGAIYSIFSTNSTTRLDIYYQKKDADTTTYSPLSEKFIIANSTPRYHSLKRTNFGETALYKYLPQPDTSELYEFVQGGLLMKVFVKFPYLDQIDEAAVSRAELVLSVEQDFLGSDRRFAPPLFIRTIYADENGEEEEVDGEPILISTPSQYDEEEGTYTISLTNYAQEIIGKSRENNGFFLVPSNRNFIINRAAIGGTSHPYLKPQFRIIYTNLPG